MACEHARHPPPQWCLRRGAHVPLLPRGEGGLSPARSDGNSGTWTSPVGTASGLKVPWFLNDQKGGLRASECDSAPASCSMPGEASSPETVAWGRAPADARRPWSRTATSPPVAARRRAPTPCSPGTYQDDPSHPPASANAYEPSASKPYPDDAPRCSNSPPRSPPPSSPNSGPFPLGGRGVDCPVYREALGWIRRAVHSTEELSYRAGGRQKGTIDVRCAVLRVRRRERR